MLTLAMMLGAYLAPPVPGPVPQFPPLLHCRIEIAAGAKGERCRVTVPPGRRMRTCTEADRTAGHCHATSKGQYVAWVVGTGPGRCRITKKKTKWEKGVVSAKLSKSEGAPSTCDLYVEVR